MIGNFGDQELLEAKYVLDKTLDQIAKEMGITEAAVKSRLHRVRTRVRRDLRRRGLSLEDLTI